MVEKTVTLKVPEYGDFYGPANDSARREVAGVRVKERPWAKVWYTIRTGPRKGQRICWCFPGAVPEAKKRVDVIYDTKHEIPAEEVCPESAPDCWLKSCSLILVGDEAAPKAEVVGGKPEEEPEPEPEPEPAKPAPKAKAPKRSGRPKN